MYNFGSVYVQLATATRQIAQWACEKNMKVLWKHKNEQEGDYGGTKRIRSTINKSNWQPVGLIEYILSIDEKKIQITKNNWQWNQPNTHTHTFTTKNLDKIFQSRGGKKGIKLHLLLKSINHQWFIILHYQTHSQR